MALLQGVPDTSPFHRSITAAQETLYYINSAGRAVHPANGSSFLVNRSSFFSGAPEYQPPSKVRIQQKPEHKFKLKSSIQMRKPHLKVPRPKHNIMKHIILAGDVTQTELKVHIDRRHTHGIYECVVCQYNSDNHRHVWKHYRTQHLYIHTHICKVKGCKDGTYGNSTQSSQPYVLL